LKTKLSWLWVIFSCALDGHGGISNEGRCKRCGAPVDVTPKEWRRR
jgi:hypothetical protein